MGVRPTDTFSSLYHAVGSRIRERRGKQKLSQEALASAVAMTRTSIANIESGRQKLFVHTLFNIADALDVEPATLLPAAKRTPKGKDGPKLPAGLDPHTQRQIQAVLSSRKET